MTARRCQFCWKLSPQKEMTVVPQSDEKRKEWVGILGEDFGKRIANKKYVFICRGHFPSDVRSRSRSKSQTPVLDFVEKCDDALSDFEVIEHPRDHLDDFEVIEEEEEEEAIDDNGSDVDYDGEVSTCESDGSDDLDDPIEYALVDVSSLRYLLSFCRYCASKAVDVKFQKPSGFALTVQLKCSSCSSYWDWCSSPFLSNTIREHRINRDATSASICTGNSYSKLSAFFRTMHVPHLQKSAHYDTLKSHLRPVVANVHDEIQDQVMKIVVETAEANHDRIDISGDAQYDSPGYTAMHGRYALLDVKTSFVVGTQLLRKKHTESSKALEPKSLDLCLAQLQNTLNKEAPSVSIRSITTDRDPSVGKLLSTKYPSITQFYDGWHFARNLKKLIWKKQDQVQMRPMKPWITKLTNHLYHSFASSDGDGQLTVEKFLSFFLHVQNIHTNFSEINGFKFQRVHQCDHGATLRNRSSWIDLNIPAHKKAFNMIWEICTAPKRVKDLHHVSPFFSTSEVESYNSLSILYHSKNSFFSSNLPMRVQLTVVHWNSLKLEAMSGDRKVTGKKSHYNKTKKEIVWKDVMSKGSNGWRRTIVERARHHRLEDTTLTETARFVDEESTDCSEQEDSEIDEMATDSE